MKKDEVAFNSLEELGDFMGNQIKKLEEVTPVKQEVEIQRWNVRTWDDYQKSDDGFWVKFSDVEKLIEELK